MFTRLTLATAASVALLAGTAQAMPLAHATSRSTPHATSGAVDYWYANTDNYQASEDVGEYPIIIDRSDDSQPGVICWGVTNKSDEAGSNFTKVPGTQVDFAAGQSSATVYLKIHDQGINGPAKLARAFMYSCGGNTVAQTPNQTITLLQNDPLQTRDPTNILGYAQPTDGDPLQYVNWFIFGTESRAGKYAEVYQRSNPAWSRAFKVLADTPGSGSMRFWMWNQPTSVVAATVEKWLADAEEQQPNTTVQITSYDLVHHGVSPSSIESRYKQWITQLAYGIGNYRVVFYLEEDALITSGRLSPAQRKVREDEIAYAVHALERDPHVVVYIDAGASDTLITPAQYAKMLRASDVAQAQGFFVNSTHNMWVTTEIKFGQRIARDLGGAHFIVQSATAGRGPDLNPHPATQGIEDLCDAPGLGLGPISWNTGYQYVDGLLWFPNVGTTANEPCHDGAPGINKFWPSYAAGIVKRRVYTVTGPKLALVKSKTDS